MENGRPAAVWPRHGVVPELTVPECVGRGKIRSFFVYLTILSRNIQYIEHKNSDKNISTRKRRVDVGKMA